MRATRRLCSNYGTMLKTCGRIAAAWPARTSMRGMYQLADNSMVGPNRHRLQTFNGTTIVAGVEIRLCV